MTRRIDPASDDPAIVRREAFAALADTAYEDDGRGVGLIGVQLSFRPARVDPDQLVLFGAD